jgi:putative endonuclease
VAYVYIIQSEEGLIYVGSTLDIDKRLYQHNHKLAGWTKRGNNWEIVHLEEYDTLSEARKRELWYKTGVGRETIKRIISSSGS